MMPHAASAFVVARPGLRLATVAAEVVRVDPLRLAAGWLLGPLDRLDALCFGPRGLGSPRWVLFDCAEVPGAIIGITRPASALPPALCRAIGDPDREGDRGQPLPIAFAAATPMLEPGHWLLYTLATADEEHAPLEALLALVLDLLRPVCVTATAQWGSRELAALAGWASSPLPLRAAWLPAHDVSATCILRLPIGEEATRPPAAARALRIDAGDEAALAALQRSIERGGRVWIDGGPVADRGGALHYRLLTDAQEP